MDEPLIYTIEGNVPEHTLDYSKEWEFTEDLIIFKEFWHKKEDGKLMKNNVHMYAKKGLAIGAAQATMQ